jgi:hypothetical protein
VAAGEDQPEQVVADDALRLDHVDRLLGDVRPDCDSVPACGQLARRARRLPAQDVEGLAPRGDGEPGARVVRDAGARPADQRRDDGVLDRVLGEVEVAERPDEGREHAGALGPDDLGEPLRRRRHSPVVRGPFGIGKTGRISTLPRQAAGI